MTKHTSKPLNEIELSKRMNSSVCLSLGAPRRTTSTSANADSHVQSNSTLQFQTNVGTNSIQFRHSTAVVSLGERSPYLRPHVRSNVHYIPPQLRGGPNERTVELQSHSDSIVFRLGLQTNRNNALARLFRLYIKSAEFQWGRCDFIVIPSSFQWNYNNTTTWTSVIPV